MAADFELIWNPGPAECVGVASSALNLVNELEDQLSIYRTHSELSRLNERFAREPVAVESRLFDLIVWALGFARLTEGAYDPTAGALHLLWRRCRNERRLPSAAELKLALDQVGCSAVHWSERDQTVWVDREGVGLNLNAVGKGYALDRMAEVLKRDWPMSGGVSSSESVPSGRDWLMHGGHSSLLAAGSVAGGDGWPVGVPHPQFPRRTYGTIWLKDRGMSTSGSGVQFYRMAGRRLGHLIDPRTGWPAESVLSVTVLAPTAVEAEALSTAFFVLGVEKTVAYCHNRPEIAAVLFPTPEVGKWAKAVVCNLGESDWMPNLPSPESR
ncbi:MAG: FAD:protein FMN transferase [Planctomycetaceae bacterium]